MLKELFFDNARWGASKDDWLGCLAPRTNLITLSPGMRRSIDPQNNHTLNPFPRKQTFVGLSYEGQREHMVSNVCLTGKRINWPSPSRWGSNIICGNRWRILNPLNTLMVVRCQTRAYYAIICRGTRGILRRSEPLKGIYSCFPLGGPDGLASRVPNLGKVNIYIYVTTAETETSWNGPISTRHR